MAIPDFQSVMLPVLRLAVDGPIRTSNAIVQICDVFGLSDEERRERLASGRQTRIANRVYWAFVHLAKAGLLRREARGVYAVTPEGQQALAGSPMRIDMSFLMACSEAYRQFRKASSASEVDDAMDLSPDSAEAGEETPDERMEAAFAELNAALQSDLRERIQAMSAVNFEKLIVTFMSGLGYGDRSLAVRTGGPGDGGIDGIVTEDVLGLDVIYLQAKKYGGDSAVGPDKIREFAGAMDAHGITRGVFFTTGRYTKAAREYAERSHKSLRLIDGDELAELMLRHGIGVRSYRTLELKRLDTDFFEELEE